MKTPYRHLFFDLDHTLWDFERSAEETKQELFESLGLKSRGIESYEAFRKKYVPINTQLWALYREDRIEKKELNFRRFYDTLCLFGLTEPELGHRMAAGFIEGISNRTHLFPFAAEILAYLSPRYHIHVITNGFEEVQYSKLKNSGLGKYFETIITSEDAGAKKPDPAIFSYALTRTGASTAESLMVGDDLEVDIAGARNAGMAQLLVNHERNIHNQPVTFEVSSLEEIKNIL
jgi:putative hydrolase of the HAD superfamily